MKSLHRTFTIDPNSAGADARDIVTAPGGIPCLIAPRSVAQA